MHMNQIHEIYVFDLYGGQNHRAYYAVQRMHGRQAMVSYWCTNGSSKFQWNNMHTSYVEQ